MATRRPRVPKTSQRQLAQVGAGAAQRPGTAGTGPTPHLVGGHSAKVIPLDAAPSRQARDATEPLESRDREPVDQGPEDQEPVDQAPAVRELSGSPAPTPEPTPAQSAPPELTPGQRRADERRNLVRRSAPRVPGRGRTADRGETRSSAATAGPAAASASTSASPSSPALAAVEPVPARNLTGRSVAFLVVLFVAAVLLAPTLRVFLDQQAELRAVREEIATEQQLQQDLTSEIARWEDPAYIQQQARERFNLVMPGEQTYMVIGGDEAVEDPVPAPASPSEVNGDMPWADALLDSVVRAGTD